MLSVATIEASVRTLLNEATQNFWRTTDISNWCTLAATDISARTFCIEETENVTLATGTQIYTPTKLFLRINGVVYTNVYKALYRAAPWMQGLQTAIASGPPEYFYEYAGSLEIFPAPSSSENGHLLRLLMAVESNDITKIPNRYLLSAVLFVTGLGFAKERQAARASQFFSWYISTLQSDVQNIAIPKMAPPALDFYKLRQVSEVETSGRTATTGTAR